MRIIGNHHESTLEDTLPVSPEAYYQHLHPRFWFFQNFFELVVREAAAQSTQTMFKIAAAPIVAAGKEVVDRDIESHLGERHIFTATHVCVLIRLLVGQQTAGEAGLLGEDNIFYTASCVARVLHVQHMNRWLLSAWRRGDVAWQNGDLVWFPC